MHDHEDNPTLAKVMFDQLEFRNGGGDNQFVMDAQAWIGKDLNKFWLKADIEQSDGETEEAELHALYSRAITSYWDLQIGLREDIKPKPTDSWGVIGVHGLAPYFFELDAAFFVGESGDTAARFSAEYELLFTQRLILSPEFEFNLYGQRDTRKMTGAGLSDVNAGLRLRYEIFREFAPYIGVHWNKKFGETADFSRISDEATSDTQVVAGIRAWF
ncbi:MAG: copper resistance protein B [Gammaproteobacteria bacterium]|nr:MAG: copper resistance protein B [Gammaproteobacteria bacterium]